MTTLEEMVSQAVTLKAAKVTDRVRALEMKSAERAVGFDNRIHNLLSRVSVLETRLQAIEPTWKPEVPNEGKTAHVPSVFTPKREVAVVPSIQVELEEDNKRLREKNKELKAMYKQERKRRIMLVDLRDKYSSQIAELKEALEYCAEKLKEKECLEQSHRPGEVK